MTDPSFLFGQFVSGLTTAMFLFLIASGLSLISGVLRVLNFAHGSFYMVGAYSAWQFVQWLGPRTESFWLAVFLGALAVATLFMGVYPLPFTEVMHASVNELLRHISAPKL